MFEAPQCEQVSAKAMSQPIEWQLTIVLLVAVVDELKKVLSALSGMATEARTNDKDIHRKYYLPQGNVLLQILLAKLPDPCQGGDAAGFLAASLVERYNPYLIGMVGLCAGDARRVTLGDVVIASATVRHDFGKLSKRHRLWPFFEFEHRRESQKIKGHVTTDILEFLEHYSPEGFTVHFGVISSGNQVTKVPGVFEYLMRKVVAGFTGDEYSRGLIALEMEAHAVAYAAEKSSVPMWLIVKGVSDYADLRKSDHGREQAVLNAYEVMLELIRDVAIERFVREPENNGIAEERMAREAFRAGDIIGASDSARKAHAFGRRSNVTRRRYIQSLTQLGDYEGAERLIREYEETGVLYDQVTREMEATILWRQGRYEEACRILPDEVLQGHRQLLYLRAMSELFLYEPVSSVAPGEPVPAKRDHIERARAFLEAALQIEKPSSPWRPSSPWWIIVNWYWVLRLLEAPPKLQEAAFMRASSSLEDAIIGAGRGTPRLYRLFLLATSDRKEEFSDKVSQGGDGRNIYIAMETIDMVYLRLRILGRRGIIGDYEHYWAEICAWLRRVRTVGRPVRDETRDLLK